MKKKSNHINQRIKRSTNKQPWQEKLFERTGLLKSKPLTEEVLHTYGHAWIQFCKDKLKENDLRSDNPLTFYFEDFLCEEGIPWDTMKGWRKRSPYLDECIKLGLMMVGLHQERGATIKKFSDRMIQLSLHNYLERWRTTDAYQAKLKSDHEGQPTQVVINMKDYSNAE